MTVAAPTLAPSYLAALEMERRKRARERSDDITQSWEHWIRTLFPAFVSHPFAEHHSRVLSWFWAHRANRPMRPLAVILPRGGGKSTMAELGTVMVGALESRRFVLYVRSTQEQADASVDNLAALMESRKLSEYYSEFADRAVGKYGNPKGWNRNRLRTANGFYVDAYGLDVAKRGVRVEEVRPDLIIFDDIDELKDTPAETKRKSDFIALDLLPTGTAATSVFGCQNLLLSDGVFAQIANGSAEFLRNVQVIGPVKAINDLTYEQREDVETGRYVYHVTGGTPTWKGQGIEECTRLMNMWGPFAFLREAQHEVHLSKGSIFDGISFRTIGRQDVPPLKRIVTWCDPVIGTTDGSDTAAICTAGLDFKKQIYVMHAWAARQSPQQVIERAIMQAIAYNAETVGIETDQGGETWRSVYDEAVAKIKSEHPDLKYVKFPKFAAIKSGKFKSGKTTLTKTERASRILLTAYEAGRIIHVAGTATMVEAALLRFPVSKPFDLVDALVLAVNDLIGGFKYNAGVWGK